MARNVVVLIGSLRKDSFTRRLAHALAGLAAPALVFQFAEIGDLPLYNQDIEESPPAAWKRLRDQVRSCDAVLFATPEYNRSIPGVLKNAIDIGSRPFGQNVFDGKPAAVISISPGAIGGFGANHHLRQSLVFLNMPVLQQPEAYIGGAAKLFDAQGRIANEDTRKFLKSFMDSFAKWIETTAQ
jgi:chromate reductase